jgi:putative flippase GtrA
MSTLAQNGRAGFVAVPVRLWMASGLASLAATAVDATSSTAIRGAGGSIPLSAAIGALLGAALNFILQRRAFQARHGLGRQLAGYAIVVAGALAINTTLTTLAGLFVPILPAKLLACAAVWIVWTFPVSRRVVFA